MKCSEIIKKITKLLKTWEGSKLDNKTSEEILALFEQEGYVKDNGELAACKLFTETQREELKVYQRMASTGLWIDSKDYSELWIEIDKLINALEVYSTDCEFADDKPNPFVAKNVLKNWKIKQFNRK